MNAGSMSGARAMSSILRDVLGLMKLRIGMLITLTAVVGMVSVPGAEFDSWRVLALAVSVLLASASAGMFNQYFEAGEDHRMARTRKRAFVTGALPRSPHWLWLMAAMLALALGIAWIELNPLATLHVLLGAVFYGGVYTVWLKRRTPMNIVIGGLAGSFAVLAGGAAVTSAFAPVPWMLALVLFLWTPPHFWSLAIANRDEYAEAGVPMLPVVVGNQRAARAVLVCTVVLFLASLLPYFAGLGLIYLTGAVLGSAIFVQRAYRLVISQDRSTALRCFFASLLQLSLLLIAAGLDRALA